MYNAEFDTDQFGAIRFKIRVRKKNRTIANLR